MTLLLIKDLSAEGAEYYELVEPFIFLNVLLVFYAKPAIHHPFQYNDPYVQ